MSYRFSPSTGGFYLAGLHRAIPDDAVAVSPARHAELMAAQASGARITANAQGRPVIERAADTIAQRRAGVARQIKREAARRIEAVSPAWRQLNDMRAPSPEGLARFAAIDAIRAASDAIDAALGETAGADVAAFPVASHPLWPASTEPASAQIDSGDAG